MRVLVVENSSHICKRLLSLLADSGLFACLSCATGVAEALARIADEPPDAMLLDLSLDDGSGFDVLTSLRSQGLALPVVVFSENDGWQYRGRALTLGANAFLCKSSQFEEIIPTLTRLLQLPACADGAGCGSAA